MLPVVADMIGGSMGFWSGLASIAGALADGFAYTQSHPALRKAWDRYAAKGYEIVTMDTYEATGRKEGMFTVSTVTLRVDVDGSVVVEEDGALTSGVYVIPPGPMTPTIAEFEAERAAKRAEWESSGDTGQPGAQAQQASADVAWACQILEVSAGAPAAEIRSAYRTKAREYHPDNYASAPQAFRDLAHEKTAELSRAREILLGGE